jgi:transcription elongation factor GreA
LEAHPETVATFLAAVQLVAQLAIKAEDTTPGAMLSLALLMDRVPGLDSTVQIPEALTVESMISDAEATLAALPTIPVSADRKAILNRLKKLHNENWEDLFEQALYLGQNDVGDHCLKELLAANAYDRLTRTIFDILKQFRKLRGSFMWLYRAINGKNYHDALPNPGKVSLLERLLLLHTHVHNSYCQTDSQEFRKEFRLIEKTMQARKYASIRDTLRDCTDGASVRLYNMVRNSRSLSEDVKDGVVAAILRTRPEVGKANIEEDESGVVIDERTIYVSRDGYERYETEFNSLVNDAIPANAKEIGKAADHGDLSENAEWTAALEKQGFLTRRAEEMRDALDRARVIDESMVAGDSVAVGCRVEVENLDESKTETLTLLGPWEADTDRGIISYLSPLGRGLLGLKPGATAEIELPSGTVRYTVNSIENALAPT